MSQLYFDGYFVLGNELKSPFNSFSGLIRQLVIYPNALSIDTGKLTIKESLDEILNVYRKMATVG